MLADFGIALAVKEAAGNRLTETGLSLGTPQYMSPEQATGDRQLDARSDVYSLAAVVYEMLAGEPPHSGPTVQAIIGKLMTERPTRLRVVRDAVPEGIDNAVTKALAKVPADRFATVREFAEALAKTPATRRFRRSHTAAVFLGGVAILGLAALASRSLMSRPRATPTHRQVTFTGHVSAPALSADQHWLAYASDNKLFVQDLLSPAAPVSVAHAALWLGNLRWSPDGAHLFYLADDSTGSAVHVVSRQGGAPRRLGTGVLFDLTPAGDLLYMSIEPDSVIVLDAASGARRGGFSLLPLANTVYSLAVSPDSRWLAFTGVKGSVTSLGVCRTDGSEARLLVGGVPRWGSLAWSKAGNAIYYLRDLGSGANVSAAGDVMKVRIAAGSGDRSGEPVTVLAGAFVQEFFLSADGRHLTYTKAAPQQRIWAMTLEGPASHPTVATRELTTGTSIYATPDISPDGRWVAFARNDGGTGNLYITPFERYDPRPLVSSPADEWSPRFSPDARQVAYAVRDSASPGIQIVDIATGQVRRVAGDGLAQKLAELLGLELPARDGPR